MEKFPESQKAPETISSDVFDMSPIREKGAYSKDGYIVQAGDNLLSSLRDWFDNLLKEKGLDPENKKLSQICYEVLELGKNAFHHGEIGGKVSMEINNNIITVIIEDQGEGFDPLEAQNWSTGGGYGLAEAIKWADTIEIETDGKKYSKPKRTLKLTGQSTVTTGTKITFTKKYQ